MFRINFIFFPSVARLYRFSLIRIKLLLNVFTLLRNIENGIEPMRVRIRSCFLYNNSNIFHLISSVNVFDVLISDSAYALHAIMSLKEISSNRSVNDRKHLFFSFCHSQFGIIYIYMIFPFIIILNFSYF